MKFILSALFVASSALVCHADAATEPANLPDLIVTRVGVLGRENQVGTEAHLVAFIENRGTVATKKDVAPRVTFFVDNEFIAHSDAYRQALEPSQFAILLTKDGPEGNATWKITPGKHTIRAIIDDSVHIDESNEGNNSFEMTFDWRTPAATNSNARPEFRDVSLEIYQRLVKIDNAGLFMAAHGTHLPKMPLTRYESAVALAQLQDTFPDIKSSDKARRLKAIEKASHKTAPTEIDTIDADILAMQTEFSDELQRINARDAGIEVRNISPMTVPPPRQTFSR